MKRKGYYNDYLGEQGKKLIVKLIGINSNCEEYAFQLSKCKEKNDKFVDDVFPPNQESLLNPLQSSFFQQKALRWKGVCWKRITDIYDSSNLKIFQENISPNDFSQGELRDSYFLSAIGVLAEKPWIIDQLILSKEVNEYGIYQAKVSSLNNMK